MSVWPTVRDTFPSFTRRFEGWLPWLYEDRIGLMTTGLGNLLDTQPPSANPTPMCLSLPWVRADGSRASKEDITAAWRAVRARPELRPQDGHAYQDVTTIRLPTAAIAALVAKKFDEHDGILTARFPDYIEWPAVAQLAIHSMAWALGPRFRFPKFEQAANANPPDFETMAKQCCIPGGLPLRNTVNTALFEAAHTTQRDMPASAFAELTIDSSTLFGVDAVAAPGTKSSGGGPHWGRIAFVLGAVGAAGFGVARATRSTP